MFRNTILSAIGIVALASSAKAAVVINEGYGGGGNSGATFINDFVELYNNGLTSVDISNYQLAYASATGAFTPTPGTDTTNFVTLIPSGTTLAAGAYVVLQEGAGAGGTATLPGTIITDATPINMSGTTFKIELLDTTGAVVDLVGVGPTANAFEGLAPAPIISNTTSASRRLNGVDTNQNAVDFQSVTPTPNAVNAVPEPATLGLAALGAVISLGRRRRI